MHCSWRWLLRRGLEFHVCTINKSAHTKKSLETYLMILLYICFFTLIICNLIFKQVCWFQVFLSNTNSIEYLFGIRAIQRTWSGLSQVLVLDMTSWLIGLDLSNYVSSPVRAKVNCCKSLDQFSCRGVRHSKWMPWIWHWIIWWWGSSNASLPDPLWPIVVATDRVLSVS